MYKRRFCAHYPDSHKCKRGSNCAFAHSRAEYRGALLPVDEEHEGWHSDDFYMKHFKTLWCPMRMQHDWQKCVYAHNYLDIRRCPTIGYGPKICPYWDNTSHQTTADGGCPNGVNCPYAHGAKEQLYHPAHFKTIQCRDMMCPEGCPRSHTCAFYHNEEECRKETAELMEYDYTKPLDDKQVEKLQRDFRCPRPSLSHMSKPSKDVRPKKKEAPQAPPVNPMPAYPQAQEPSQPPCVYVMMPVPMHQLAMQYQMMAMQQQVATQMAMQAQMAAHNPTTSRKDPVSSFAVVNSDKYQKIAKY
jgi:hypothetical protein